MGMVAPNVQTTGKRINGDLQIWFAPPSPNLCCNDPTAQRVFFHFSWLSGKSGLCQPKSEGPKSREPSHKVSIGGLLENHWVFLVNGMQNQSKPVPPAFNLPFLRTLQLLVWACKKHCFLQPLLGCNEQSPKQLNKQTTRQKLAARLAALP